MSISSVKSISPNIICDCIPIVSNFKYLGILFLKCVCKCLSSETIAKSRFWTYINDTKISTCMFNILLPIIPNIVNASYLLSKCKKENETTRIQNELYDAINKDKIHLVKTLLSKNPSLDLNYHCGAATPLLLACVRGNQPIVKMLVEHGAHADFKSVTGRDPLTEMRGLKEAPGASSTTRAQAEEIFQFLEQSMCPPTPASGMGSSSSVPSQSYSDAQLSIKNGLLEIRFQRDIMAAIAESNVELLTRLLDSPSLPSLNFRYMGETPLTSAAKKGNLTIIKMLIDKGAQVNYPNLSGHTPLTKVSHHGLDSEVVQFLSSLTLGSGVLPIDRSSRSLSPAPVGAFYF